MATKLFLLLAICVLPVLVNANCQPFQIFGKVYCDTCRAGFETIKCSYIPGARVEIKCYDRTTLRLKFSVGARNKATVILTRSNGALSNIHFANAMGFLRDTAAAGCAELLRSLLQDDE
ncbi:Detected protein of unknown function [Hibiscus syriacus]|uniref:Uncharacterized protein n=1 Tax=Hibiscus syriacus TaxID=106335 RepID=A0A6A3AAT9_HIBSY|nr:Detected protein of unknown function [Hibiscus syriacus]